MNDAMAAPMSDNPTAGSTLDVASAAARQGAADAYEAANRAFESTSLFLSRFTYTACYTISYGVVFPATYVALSVPRNNALVRGLMDGARAAREQVDKVMGPATAPEPAPETHG
jgi:hypothetical protein